MYLCRPPEDTCKMAKIVKLLLMMEKSVATENQGKILEEIDVLLEAKAETQGDDGKFDFSWLSSSSKQPVCKLKIKVESDYSGKVYKILF